MAKFYNPAIPIKVHEGENGIPTGFAYNRKPVKVGRIRRQWRIREGWWREEIAREYFDLETGRFACTIYRDLIDKGWYLQRIYD